MKPTQLEMFEMPRGFQERSHPTSKVAQGHRTKGKSERRPRLTVSFVEADFWAAQRIAEATGVPLSQVVRDAVRAFVAQRDAAAPY